MADHATSADATVQAQLDRLWALSPGADVLGLERITRLLARLGHPERDLPPVFHVAGTNGKGSTCAFLCASLEAAGHRVHAYTSPHLVRFNERIRVAGRLIEDATLATLLAEVLDRAGGIGASFFEVTTAAAFLHFARTPADACVIEVGLGGRLDATNVLPAPAVCGIAALGIDHEAFLLVAEEGTPPEPLARIAFEKAGIAKPGVPLVVQAYPPEAERAVVAVARAQKASLYPRGPAWDAEADEGMLHYRDAAGSLHLPLPTLAGMHQADNAALAVAMLRRQEALTIPSEALAAGISAARWPARLQHLRPGPLAALAPDPSAVWLDGGHNPSAGMAIATALDSLVAQPGGADRPLIVILGMLANKDAGGLLGPIASRVAALIAVPIAGHAHHPPAALAETARALGIARADTAPDVVTALRHAGPPTGSPPVVLILGSLYLAGAVLAANDEPPV